MLVFLGLCRWIHYVFDLSARPCVQAISSFFIRPNKGTPIEANRRREIDRGVQTMQIDMENTRTIESRRQSTVTWLINSTVASSSGRGE